MSDTHQETGSRSKKKDNLVRLTSDKLEQQAEAGDGTALEAVKRITKAHSTYKTALAHKATVSTECKNRLDSENAAFKEAIEAPLKANANRNAVLAKLTTVESRWQELSEVKSRNIEERKGSKEDVKAALEALDLAIKESAQLALPGLA